MRPPATVLLFTWKMICVVIACAIRWPIWIAAGLGGSIEAGFHALRSVLVAIMRAPLVFVRACRRFAAMKALLVRLQRDSEQAIHKNN